MWETRTFEQRRRLGEQPQERRLQKLSTQFEERSTPARRQAADSPTHRQKGVSVRAVCLQSERRPRRSPSPSHALHNRPSLKEMDGRPRLTLLQRAALTHPGQRRQFPVLSALRAGELSPESGHACRELLRESYGCLATAPLQRRLQPVSKTPVCPARLTVVPCVRPAMQNVSPALSLCGRGSPSRRAAHPPSVPRPGESLKRQAAPPHPCPAHASHRASKTSPHAAPPWRAGTKRFPHPGRTLVWTDQVGPPDRHAVQAAWHGFSSPCHSHVSMRSRALPSLRRAVLTMRVQYST